MSEHVCKQVENDVYILKIVKDEYAENPRIDDDGWLGTMICFHPRYNLGDEHDYSEPNDFILDLLTQIFEDSHEAKKFVERVTTSFNRDNFKNLSEYNKAIDNKLLETVKKEFVILPLYLYDHSGITMNTTGFSCPWDSGQVGWIYTSKENAVEMLGIAYDYETVKKHLEDDVKSIRPIFNR
jgi:hypothetical protein